MHGQVSWSVLRNRLPVGSDWLAKPPTNLVGGVRLPTRCRYRQRCRPRRPRPRLAVAVTCASPSCIALPLGIAAPPRPLDSYSLWPLARWPACTPPSSFTMRALASRYVVRLRAPGGHRHGCIDVLGCMIFDVKAVLRCCACCGNVSAL